MKLCSRFYHSPLKVGGKTFTNTLLAVILLLSALPAAAQAASLEITGPDGATVVINGHIMGFLPLVQPLTLGPGIYEIKSDLPGYLPFETTVTLANKKDWQRLHIRPIPMSKKTAWTSNLLFAGMGQHYMGKPIKGYFFNLMEAGGLLMAFSGELQRSDFRKDYLLQKNKYDLAINPVDQEYYQGLAENAYSDMEDMEKLRDTGLMIAGGAIVLSILDTLLFFPGIEVGPGEIPVQTGALDSSFFNESTNPLQTVHAGFKLGF